MKNLLFIILSIFLYSKATGQNAIPPNSRDEQMTNMFEYGEILTSPETNFKNLFKNFPLLVSGNDLELLSYKFVKSIPNKNSAKFFINKNSNLTEFSGVTMATGGSDGPHGSFIKFNFGVHSSFSKKRMKEMFVQQCMQMFTDKPTLVYVIRFAALGKEYKLYTFIDPNTYKVTDGNMFGFDLPLSYTQYKERSAKKQP
ncbi:MAG: hypothetical protein H7Y13_14265 [Sphingobacteriaceae bacterium]|nr:hypothetical protein [Sphingobacteriaceae bacterium]